MGIGTAGAIVGAGALGAAGSLASAGIASSAQQSAASKESSAATQAAALQEQGVQAAIAAQKGYYAQGTQDVQNFFNQSYDYLKPQITEGNKDLSTLTSLLNPGTAQKTLQSLPGFQFQSQYGTMSAENALAAEGLGGSKGPLAQSISSYNNGLANTYYSNYVSQLQSAAGLGLSADTTAANLSGQAGTSLANLSAGVGTNISNAIQSGANAAASGVTSSANAIAQGQIGSANALASGIGSAGTAISNSALLSQLLNNNSNAQSGGGGFYATNAQPEMSQPINDTTIGA